MSSVPLSVSEPVQAIDEAKQFQQEAIDEYFKNLMQEDPSPIYRVISVFGSQSTGKSTLLNRLFQTNFDVMDDKRKQQTTKGIWLGYTSDVNSILKAKTPEKLLIMDVEGSDGRERGEDQDFERKAALFALATSQVLIVNIWEHQVGLYHGANMGLLKTVFEVNLSLFGNQNHKVLLLFVIRDYIGNTPLEYLAELLLVDLNNLWGQIAKPPNVPQDVKITDYFDFEFTALANKLLQPEEFDLSIKQLGNKFIDYHPSYIFKHESSFNLPMDAWPLYAKGCWEQIQANKDLDLPQQQTLVTQFRCEEIAKESFSAFEGAFHKTFDSADLGTYTGKDLANLFVNLIKIALKSYDAQANRYNKDIYTARKEALWNQTIVKLKTIHESFVAQYTKSSLTKFKTKFTDKTDKTPFAEKSRSMKERTICELTKTLSSFTEIHPDMFAYEAKLQKAEEEIDNEISQLRDQEIQNLVNRLLKKIKPYIENRSIEIFSQPDKALWDRILDNFEEALQVALTRFVSDNEEGFDFHVGDAPNINLMTADKIRQAAWNKFDEFIHGYLREDNIVNILRRIFEDNFSYDQNNIPRIWKNESEVEDIYQKSSSLAIEKLSIFATARLSNGSEIAPESDELESDDDDDEEPRKFAQILTIAEQSKIKTRFLKSVRTIFADANRSVQSNKIKSFKYVEIAVYGWVGFSMCKYIFNNPFFMFLVFILVVSGYLVDAFNCWGPLLNIGRFMFNEAKARMANALTEIHEIERGQALKVPAYGVSSYQEEEEEE